MSESNQTPSPSQRPDVSKRRSRIHRFYLFVDRLGKGVVELLDVAWEAVFFVIATLISRLARLGSITMAWLLRRDPRKRFIPINLLKIGATFVIVAVGAAATLLIVLLGGSFSGIFGLRNIAEYSLKEQIAAWMMIAILVMGLPLLLPSYSLFKVSVALAYALGVVGLDFLYGQCGIVSLGHAGFLLLGGYVTTWLSSGAFGFELPMLVAVALGGAVAGVFGLLLGAPSLRIKDYYLVIITMAFSLVVPKVLKAPILATLSGAREGGLSLRTMKTPELLGSITPATATYLFVAIPAFVLFYVAYNINHRSQIGRAFKTIRCDNEVSMILGIPVVRYKMLAFTLSAVYAGVCGGFLTVLTKFIHPDSYVITDSIHFIVANVVGGPESLLGSVFGGAFLAYEQDLTHKMADVFKRGQDLAAACYGLVLITAVLFAPRGVIGGFTAWLKSKVQPATRRGTYYFAPPPDYDFLRDEAAASGARVDG